MSGVNRKWLFVAEYWGFLPLIAIGFGAVVMGSEDPKLRHKVPPPVEKKAKVVAAAVPAASVEKEAAAATPVPVATPAAGTYAISGIAKFEGKAPALPAIKMGADPKCVAMHGGKDVSPDELVVGAAGELANVFVYVKAGAEKQPAPKTPGMIDQRGCVYVPHVVGLVAGQPLKIVSSDETLHNVHCLAKTNPEFNMAQPSPSTREKSFKKPEMAIKLKCDVHPWMNAWIHVLEHPFFAVSDAQGAFKIVGLKPGKYTIEAWHEKLGTMTKDVTVGEADATGADFSFAEKK